MRVRSLFTVLLLSCLFIVNAWGAAPTCSRTYLSCTGNYCLNSGQCLTCDDPVEDEPDTGCGYADDIYKDSGLIQRAQLQRDGDKCVLANGTYYDKRGTIQSNNTCSFGCATGYKKEDGKCVKDAPACVGGYNIGSGSYSCVDPTENSTTGSPSSSTMTWSATFTYGAINGRATCVTNGGGDPGDTDSYNDLTKKVYTDNGANCWCQMTTPRRSGWVFMSGSGAGQGTSQQVTACKNGCANDCLQGILHVQRMREGLYGTEAGSNQ